MKKGLYIFDCDGVVREFSMCGIYELYVMFCQEFGADHERLFPTFHAFRSWYSHDWKENLRRLGIVDSGDVQRTVAFFHQFYEPRVNIFPWVEEVFAKLAQEHYVAICSNSSVQSIERTLNGVLRHVDVVMGFDRMPRLKPHPDGLHLIMNELHIDPEHTIILGDAEPDIQAGHAANILTAAVSWGATETQEELVSLGAHAIIYKPEDIYRLL